MNFFPRQNQQAVYNGSAQGKRSWALLGSNLTRDTLSERSDEKMAFCRMSRTVSGKAGDGGARQADRRVEGGCLRALRAQWVFLGMGGSQ